MSTAKDITVKPIDSASANKICKKIHYSGKVVPSSQIHFTVIYREVIGKLLPGCAYFYKLPSVIGTVLKGSKRSYNRYFFHRLIIAHVVNFIENISRIAPFYRCKQ